MIERLQKFLANAGVASRRKSEELILQGKISVNGKVVCELGTKIDTDKDVVEYNGKEVRNKDSKIYILLNKPIDYVTTVHDQFGRNTVLDLIDIKEKIVPVGRLDMYTSGALILSNDGEFINNITHPSHEIEKTYNVTIRGIISDEDIEKLKSGVEIQNNDEVYVTRPARVKILKIDEEKKVSRLEIVIHEGKNRQIRKMCEAIGKSVIALHRSKIGSIGVKDLKIGTWRYLRDEEVKGLLDNLQ